MLVLLTTLGLVVGLCVSLLLISRRSDHSGESLTEEEKQRLIAVYRRAQRRRKSKETQL
jgi:hypothetical protein